MKIARDKFGKLFRVFDASGFRQRVMVTTALIVTVHAAWDHFIYQPITRENEQLTQSLVSNSEQFATLTTELQTLARANLEDTSEIDALQQQITYLETQIDLATSEFIAPAQMPEVLRKLLSKNSELRITGLRTEPARRLSPAGGSTFASAAAVTDVDIVNPPIQAHNNAAFPVYQHNVTLDFEGDYLSTLAYIRSIEQLGWRIFWDSVHIDSSEYPRSRVSVSLYTLSLEEGWIGV